MNQYKSINPDSKSKPRLGLIGKDSIQSAFATVDSWEVKPNYKIFLSFHTVIFIFMQFASQPKV